VKKTDFNQTELD